MAPIAGSGGHVAGSLNIIGTLNTKNIETGFEKIKTSFSAAKGYISSFGADMTRVSQVVSGISSKLVKMGTVGFGAMAALAKGAPAVAPALASMGVSLLKLSFALGDALAPAFEKAAVWLDKFATWVADNKGGIQDVTNAFITLGEKIGGVLLPPLQKVADWAIENPNLFAGIVGGLILGPKVIAGIGAISGLVTTLSASVIGASVLTALGSIAAIAAGGLGGSIIGTEIGEKTYESVGKSFLTSDVGSSIGSAFAGLSDYITGGNTQQGFNEALSSYNKSRNEDDRKSFLMDWWDSIFG